MDNLDWIGSEANPRGSKGGISKSIQIRFILIQSMDIQIHDNNKIIWHFGLFDVSFQSLCSVKSCHTVNLNITAAEMKRKNKGSLMGECGRIRISLEPYISAVDLVSSLVDFLLAIVAPRCSKCL